jgi:hypothetical protein
VFKKGDLLQFNDHGQELFRYVTGSVAVIYSDRSVMYESESYLSDKKLCFYTYDVIVCGTLFKNIPEEFLKRITYYEKDT